ncbi:hypothetical protein [Paenibacillus illinoisensis]|uniref:hypothetical protein n=1 Tax=Paenibacillus illinoisensis TaxID=59845 RepID=UPI00203A76A4|nr:hypothetical protein [Paenibacillus illinoisensis]MCM3205629.1 hypothetical protein [Paenibacillus illinoisensis]
MRIETSALAKEHLSYITSDPIHSAELKAFKTVSAHFFHYLVTIRGLLPDTAQGIVADFQADMDKTTG